METEAPRPMWRVEAASAEISVVGLNSPLGWLSPLALGDNLPLRRPRGRSVDVGLSARLRGHEATDHRLRLG